MPDVLDTDVVPSAVRTPETDELEAADADTLASDALTPDTVALVT